MGAYVRRYLFLYFGYYVASVSAFIQEDFGLTYAFIDNATFNNITVNGYTLREGA